jgi:hypothetical protein
LVLVRTRSGRRYGTSRPKPAVDWLTPTPSDPRTGLPLSKRIYTDTTLPDGTVYRDWQDPPLSSVAAREPTEAAAALPEEQQPITDPRRHTAATPKERWIGPVGPMPWRP